MPTYKFPSLSALRGVGSIFGKLKPKSRRATRKTEQLNILNTGYSPMVDTFVYNYPQLVRDNSAPFANVTDTSIKVAIIGAGFPGAKATYELHQAGITDIIIYEARQQKNGQVLVGGRAYSPTFKSNRRKYVN